jgi:hypothetical protein
VAILVSKYAWKTNVVKIHLMIIYQCIQVDPKQFHIFQICFTLEAILDFWSGWKILLRTIQWLFMYNLDSNSSLFSKENILRLWQSSWIYFICTKNTYCIMPSKNSTSISIFLWQNNASWNCNLQIHIFIITTMENLSWDS